MRWQLRESRNGHTDTQYVWLDPKLRTALKVQMGPPTIELQNIQEETQAARCKRRRISVEDIAEEYDVNETSVRFRLRVTEAEAQHHEFSLHRIQS